jgi:hypothetical protein
MKVVERLIVPMAYTRCSQRIGSSPNITFVASPLQQLARRLGFGVLGVFTLVALSEISKLDLHQYLKPPKVSQKSSLTIGYTQTSHQA